MDVTGRPISWPWRHLLQGWMAGAHGCSSAELQQNMSPSRWCRLKAAASSYLMGSGSWVPAEFLLPVQLKARLQSFRQGTASHLSICQPHHLIPLLLLGNFAVLVAELGLHQILQHQGQTGFDTGQFCGAAQKLCLLSQNLECSSQAAGMTEMAQHRPALEQGLCTPRGYAAACKAGSCGLSSDSAAGSPLLCRWRLPESPGWG